MCSSLTLSASFLVSLALAALEVAACAVFAAGFGLADLPAELILPQSFLGFPAASVQSDLVPVADWPGEAAEAGKQSSKLPAAMARDPRCLFMGMPPHEKSRQIEIAFDGGVEGTRARRGARSRSSSPR